MEFKYGVSRIGHGEKTHLVISYETVWHTTGNKREIISNDCNRTMNAINKTTVNFDTPDFTKVTCKKCIKTVQALTERGHIK